MKKKVTMRFIALSAVLLGITGMPLAAADMTIADLRLSVGVLSREYKGASTTTVTDTGNTVTTTTSSEDGRDADDNWRGQLQFVGGSLDAGGGLIWGVGIAVNHATWDNGAQDAHVTTPTVGAMLGYGYAFTPNWHIEIAPFAGYGRAYYSVSDSNSTETSEEWSDYLEYGARIGTFFSLGDDLVLGVEVPYLVGRFDPDYEYIDDNDGQVTVSDERRNKGFGVLVSIAGRF
jgi:hypothetical protein